MNKQKNEAVSEVKIATFNRFCLFIIILVLTVLEMYALPLLFDVFKISIFDLSTGPRLFSFEKFRIKKRFFFFVSF